MAEILPPIEMTLPSYYRKADPKGDSMALALTGYVVAIDDDEETFDFIVRYPRFAKGRAVRIVRQPLALDYDVHASESVCHRCGRPVEVDNIHGRENPNANYCLGTSTCLQQFAPATESMLEIGNIVRVQIDRESAFAN